jgi:hypothetical protein
MSEQQQSMGAIEAATEGIKEGVKAFAPGLTLGKILSEIGETAKHMNDMGRSELAAALFSGTSNAFVMYPRDNNQPAKDGEGQQMNPPEQDRGMEM